MRHVANAYPPLGQSKPAGRIGATADVTLKSIGRKLPEGMDVGVEVALSIYR